MISNPIRNIFSMLTTPVNVLVFLSSLTLLPSGGGAL